MSTKSKTTRTVQVDRIYINATPQAIWDALTQPGWAWTRTYGETMKALGMPAVTVDGEVIEADPPRKLVQIWRLLMDPRVAAEGVARFDYEIEHVTGGVTRLTVTHDVSGAPTLTSLVSGDSESARGRAGWSQALADLKTQLEAGGQRPDPAPTIPLRA